MRPQFTRHKFSRWDGSQTPPALDADDILAELADDLLEHGDPGWALRNLLSRGMQLPDGSYRQGLRDLIQQLRQHKAQQLQRYDLSSLMDNLREQLDAILDMERVRIQQWLDGTPEPDADGNPPDSFSQSLFRSIAERNQQQLNELPRDTAGRIKALEKYDFLHPDAQRKFLELLNQLRKTMAQSFFKDIENMVSNMSAGDMERMKAMLQALNAMIVQRIAGQTPDFAAFMREFGDMFGPNPPGSLDELLDMMRQQMAASQSLLASLNPSQRQQLESLLADRFNDPALNAELQKLRKELDFLMPESQRYRFRGDEPLDLDAAMQLMNQLQRMDDMIDQLQYAERYGELDDINQQQLEQLLGAEAGENLTQLKDLLDALEQAGYIRTDGDALELTPRGSRLIGQRALGEIYARLRKQNLGNHAVPEEGRFGERLEQSKPYEFGDPFHLHMPRTLRNAIDREGPKTPLRLQPEDFEIYRSEMITATATALLIDLSWSMALRGSFLAAKKVALALQQLIRSQYPKDSFFVIGFAAYAKELKADELTQLMWDDEVLGTNMQHALLLAERRLATSRAGSKQIIMISDGEPTAHLANGQAQFAYPPTTETLAATLSAVQHCTRRGIAINTFMLEANPNLKAFVERIAKINGGRVFFTDPAQLGEYILVDYVQNKRKKLR